MREEIESLRRKFDALKGFANLKKIRLPAEFEQYWYLQWKLIDIAVPFKTYDLIIEPTKQNAIKFVIFIQMLHTMFWVMEEVQFL